MTKTQKLTFISVLVTQALVLHIFERMIPVPFISPGAKLGLSNIITVIALYTLGFKDTFMLIIVRIMLSALLGSNISGFLYSLAGGMLSFVTMYFIKQVGKDNISIIGVSIVGAFFHNVGQIIVAALIIQNINMVLYFPVLAIAGIGTGFFVGVTSYYFLELLKKLPIYGVLVKNK
jgi:heptaprenyl diphosphate synthase